MCMCLAGNRLVLRPLGPKDCAEMVRILADPVISYWVPVLPFPYTASDAKGFFNLLQDNPHRQVWAITLKEEFIGLIEEYPNFGFWLDPAFWGQGLISEAADLVLKKYFSDPQASPLLASVRLQNQRSMRVLVKNGFAPNGPPVASYSKALRQSVPLQPMALTPDQWHFLNPVFIETQRLQIFPLAQVHQDALFGCLTQKQVARNLAIVPHPLPRGFVGRFIEAARWKGAWNGMFALADKTQNVIGMIGFRAAPLAALVTADLVYAIHPKQWGQGLMSEAVNAFCAFLFRRYPLEAITAEHFKDNPGSRRVLQKASFVPLPVQSHPSEMGKSAARLEPAPITRYRLMRPA